MMKREEEWENMFFSRDGSCKVILESRILGILYFETMLFNRNLTVDVVGWNKAGIEIKKVKINDLMNYFSYFHNGSTVEIRFQF